MNSPTGQTRRRIFTLDGSNDADSRKGVPFGGLVDTAPHFLRGGVKSLPLKKRSISGTSDRRSSSPVTGRRDLLLVFRDVWMVRQFVGDVRM